MRKSTKKEIGTWLLIVVLNIITIGSCLYAESTRRPVENDTEPGLEAEDDIIRWKQDEMIEVTEDILRFDMEKVEVELEETEEEVVTIQPNIIDGIRYYDVPLSKELQMHVFMECDGYGFWPNVAIAVMDVECDFDLDAVSPKGAVGPMQVVEEYHWDRMELLGCDDLFDLYQNIKVGMHYLAELWSEKQDMCWVLMAYRHGRSEANEMYSRGIVDEYALEVLARAAELQLEMEERYENMESLAK